MQRLAGMPTPLNFIYLFFASVREGFVCTFYLIEFALFFHYGIKSVNVASMCCGNNKAPKQLVFICSTFRLRVSQDLIS